MKQIIIGVTVLVLFTILLFYTVSNVVHGSEVYRPKLRTEVFMENDGYGYLILNEGKVLIKQDFVPAIPGKTPFSSPKDAQLVADLIRDKLLKGESPVINVQELNNLNIVILAK